MSKRTELQKNWVSVRNHIFEYLCLFLQAVSTASRNHVLAIANASVCLFVCQSHSSLCQNDASWDHEIFTVSSVKDSSWVHWCMIDVLPVIDRCICCCVACQPFTVALYLTLSCKCGQKKLWEKRTRRYKWWLITNIRMTQGSVWKQMQNTGPM